MLTREGLLVHMESQVNCSDDPVYATGSKRSHTEGKCVTYRGFTNSSLDFKRPANGPISIWE